MNTFARCFILCLPVVTLFTGGCATYGFWQNESLEAVKAPSRTANLTVLREPARMDYLVVYDESCERNNKVHQRAYWLKSYNDLPEAAHHRPTFAKYKRIPTLPKLPVFIVRRGKPTNSLRAIAF